MVLLCPSETAANYKGIILPSEACKPMSGGHCGVIDTHIFQVSGHMVGKERINDRKEQH